MIDAYDQREERKRERQARAQFRADVQEAMKSEAMRRVLFAFLQISGEGQTVLRDTPTAMGHAAGWQDAANWWLTAVRDHCHEREAQMRAEAKRDARDSAKETEDDDGNDD